MKEVLSERRVERFGGSWLIIIGGVSIIDAAVKVIKKLKRGDLSFHSPPVDNQIVNEIAKSPKIKF